MRHRAGELDVSHAFATHLRQCNLNPALLTDDPPVLEALVLSAQALIVLHRAENLGAEQAIPLRLERAVVDGLGLFDLTVRPGTNHFGRRQADTNGIELVSLSLRSNQVE